MYGIKMGVKGTRITYIVYSRLLFCDVSRVRPILQTFALLYLLFLFVDLGQKPDYFVRHLKFRVRVRIYYFNYIYAKDKFQLVGIHVGIQSQGKTTIFFSSFCCGKMNFLMTSSSSSRASWAWSKATSSESDCTTHFKARYSSRRTSPRTCREKEDHNRVLRQ